MKPIKRFGSWEITKFGLEHTNKRIPYEIHKDRLWEEGWITHMAMKRWVLISDFQQALEFAQEYHKGGRKNG